MRGSREDREVTVQRWGSYLGSGLLLRLLGSGGLRAQRGGGKTETIQVMTVGRSNLAPARSKDWRAKARHITRTSGRASRQTKNAARKRARMRAGGRGSLPAGTNSQWSLGAPRSFQGAPKGLPDRARSCTARRCEGVFRRSLVPGFRAVQGCRDRSGPGQSTLSGAKSKHERHSNESTGKEHGARLKTRRGRRRGRRQADSRARRQPGQPQRQAPRRRARRPSRTQTSE